MKLHVYRHPIRIHLTKVETYQEHEMYISDNVKVKRRQLFNINQRITDAFVILGQQNIGQKPIFCIISQDEMQTTAIASYNFVENMIFLTPSLGENHQVISKLTHQFSKSENPISTILHELIHWQDAQEYKRRRNIDIIVDKMEYRRYCNNKAREKLEKSGIDGYNVGEISRYAKKMYQLDEFDEVLVELVVKKMLDK